MDRAQIHTLEAFLGALLIVAALLFASQATAVTPLSASTANQHIENQQERVAEDVLRLTAHDGTLQEALRYWDIDDEQFGNAPDNQTAYTGPPPEEHPLSDALATAFGAGGLAYNIELRYEIPTGTIETQEMFRMGTPSDNAVTATRFVTLFDDDHISLDAYDTETLQDQEQRFWAPRLDTDSAVYNVVEVRLTVWRM